MKRITFILLIFSAFISFTSCGSKESPKKEKAKQEQSESEKPQKIQYRDLYLKKGEISEHLSLLSNTYKESTWILRLFANGDVEEIRVELYLDDDKNLWGVKTDKKYKGYWNEDNFTKGNKQQKYISVKMSYPKEQSYYFCVSIEEFKDGLPFVAGDEFYVTAEDHLKSKVGWQVQLNVPVYEGEKSEEFENLINRLKAAYEKENADKEKARQERDEYEKKMIYSIDLLNTPVTPEIEHLLSSVGSGYLFDSDLRYYTKSSLRVLRNAIYAHHGLIFESEDLNKYFRQFDWYQPSKRGVGEETLSIVEQANLKTIQKLEKSR